MPTTADSIALATARLEQLVGIPYKLGSTDAGVGLDCLSLIPHACAIIGETLGDRRRWVAPLPPGYPFPEPAPGEPWLTDEAIGEWALSWTPIRRPRFGAMVTFGEDHVGLFADHPPTRVLHASKIAGSVVLQRYTQIKRWTSGIYVLKGRAR